MSSTSTSTSSQVRIAIIGAGPAGLFAYRSLKKLNPNIIVKIYEAGADVTERLKVNSSQVIANGFGGAGLFADRKISSFPAGTNLARSNVHQLRKSCEHVINELNNMFDGKYNDQFKLLQAANDQFIGDQNVSSEHIERFLDNMNHEDRIKLYPSVVLSNWNDAVTIFQELGNGIPDEDIIYKKVDFIQSNDSRDEFKLIHLDSIASGDFNNDQNIFYDYVILATGRLGPCNNLFKFLKTPNQSQRLEIGARLMLDSCPEVLQALLKIREGKELCYDPKVCIRRELLIGNKMVICEFRSFCVCLPSEGEGYCVRSKDPTNNLSTISGSSSVSELNNLQDKDFIFPGSNMGIMMRIEDMETIKNIIVLL